MATFSAIFPPATNNASTVSINATSASTSIVLGSSASGSLFVITAAGDLNIRFGNVDNIVDPDANSFPLYAGGYVQFQLPLGADRFRLYNGGGATVQAWYWPLGKA